MIIFYGGEVINTAEENPEERIQEIMNSDETLSKCAISMFNEISPRECTITICRKFFKNMDSEPGYITGRDGHLLIGTSLQNFWPQFLWKPCGERDEENLSGQYYIPIELFAFCYKKACEELGGDIPRSINVSTKRYMVVMRLVY